MGVLVELDRSTITRLIEEKETRIIELDGEMTSLDSEVKRLKAAIAGNQPELPQVPETSPSGRNKRGQTAHIVEEFLKVNKLRPTTAKDISRATSTSYATALRALNALQAEGKATNKNGEWSWNQ